MTRSPPLQDYRSTSLCHNLYTVDLRLAWIQRACKAVPRLALPVFEGIGLIALLSRTSRNPGPSWIPLRFLRNDPSILSRNPRLTSKASSNGSFVWFLRLRRVYCGIYSWFLPVL